MRVASERPYVDAQPTRQRFYRIRSCPGLTNAEMHRDCGLWAAFHPEDPKGKEKSKMGVFKFLFGQDTTSRAQRDQYRPSTISKNLISPINDYGTCFACDGDRQLTCQYSTYVGTVIPPVI